MIKTYCQNSSIDDDAFTGEVQLAVALKLFNTTQESKIYQSISSSSTHTENACSITSVLHELLHTITVTSLENEI